MSLDPALPPSIAAELNDLKRRLRILESAPRLTNASVTGRLRIYDDGGGVAAELGGEGGNIVVFDGVGNRLVEIGELPASPTLGGGQRGIRVLDSTGRVVWCNTSDGMLVPPLAYPAVPAGQLTPPFDVTSSSFGTVVTSSILRVPGPAVSVWVLCDVTGGATGEVRLLNGQMGASNAQAITGFAFRNFDWLHGATIHSNADFQIQLRRTNGVGTVRCWLPQTGFQFVGAQVFGATPGGT